MVVITLLRRRRLCIGIFANGVDASREFTCKTTEAAKHGLRSMIPQSAWFWMPSLSYASTSPDYGGKPRCISRPERLDSTRGKCWRHNSWKQRQLLDWWSLGFSEFASLLPGMCSATAAFTLAITSRDAHSSVRERGREGGREEGGREGGRDGGREEGAEERNREGDRGCGCVCVCVSES